MMERIQKIISSCGAASRRQAEEWIRQGRVTCNGETCQLGQSADPQTDVIRIDGKVLTTRQDRVYIMLHKPRGFVTTLSDEKGRKDVSQLVECGQRVYPVGRLDMDSEGLLLLTNDGDFANKLMHPKHQIDKTYQVSAEGYQEDSLQRLSQPVELDGYRIQPPRVRAISINGTKATLEVTIHEGRNRQVRRMCQAAGLEVARLKRIAEGRLKLGELKTGCWRELEPREIETLLQE